MPSSHGEAILNLRRLRKSFGDVDAVRDLSLDIYQGEVFGFLGPNGAGKTTTIRMICGLLRPDGGEILLAGETMAQNPARYLSRIGLCPQELVVWDTLTCLEQLLFVGIQYDMRRREAREKANELLEVLGLEAKARRLAKTLSGGMKRRLNLALALMHRPELLVLDEPQAGLDPQSRILVREYIDALSGETTVVLTTHEMDEADRLAHRIGIIDRGALLVLDTPDRLKATHAGGDILELTLDPDSAALPSPALQNIREAPPGDLEALESVPGTLRFSGRSLAEELPRLLSSLQGAGAQIKDVTLRRPTLEDVFISLTGRGLRE